MAAVLDAAGWSIAELADIFGITANAAARWADPGRSFDPELLLLAERRLGLLRHELRPDLFQGYKRQPGPMRWRQRPADRGWSKVIAAAGGGRFPACHILSQYLDITVPAVVARQYLEIEWLPKVERLFGLPRHELRPDLYVGYRRTAPDPRPDPLVMRQVAEGLAEAGRRAAADRERAARRAA